MKRIAQLIGIAFVAYLSFVIGMDMGAQGWRVRLPGNSAPAVAQVTATSTPTTAPTFTATFEPPIIPPTPTNTATPTRTPIIIPTSTPTPAPPTDTVTPTHTPTATPVPTWTPTPVSPTPIPVERALVTRVVDGDTIEVTVNGRSYRVRYILIDTPEIGTPYANEATRLNESLVLDKIVRMKKDVSETDRYGRLLRYVYLEDGTFVNAEIVRQGLATVATFPPDVSKVDVIRAAQAEAQAAGRGMWFTDTAEDSEGVDECVIKGNISYNTGERIYHVPGGEYYDQTQINTAAGERWFCTEAEAQAAGWRRSYR